MLTRPFSLSLVLLAVFFVGCSGEGRSVDATVAAADPKKQNRPPGKPTAPQTSPAKTTTADADWPRFRGPDGSGTTAAQELPVTWSHTDHIAWKTPLPGAGASSPIVLGDHVYLTSYTGYLVPGEEGGDRSNLKRHLLALSRGTGEILWDKAIPADLPEEENIRDHGFAASTPVADAERVYVFFGKTGVLAFDHQGEQLWKTNVGQNTHGWGSSASPILYKDLVIVNASVESESLVALNQQTGKEVWRAGGINEAWNTPLLVEAGDRTELVVATHGRILAFDPVKGTSLWTCDTDITWYMAPSVVAHEGVVYAIGGRSGITALAVQCGGSGDVTSAKRLWTIKDGSNVSSPVMHEGHLYFANDNREVAYCVEAATGKVIYEQRLERADQIYASALLGAGRVYYLTRGGKTFVIAAKSQFEQLAVNDLSDGGIFNSSPAVSGQHLLIRSDKFLYCVEK